MRATGKALLVTGVLMVGCAAWVKTTESGYRAYSCVEAVAHGVRPLSETRGGRFLGKVQSYHAACRGGHAAVAQAGTPWVDWSNYFDTSDSTRLSAAPFTWWPVNRLGLGVNGALVDLEYERMELIRYNLFDNSGTYRDYVLGRNGTDGPLLRTWDAMRLPPTHPNYNDVGGARTQVCQGALIRARTLTGICNDTQNPLMGSTGTLFARNVEFGTTFPDEGLTPETKARHGGRIKLLTPDPQVISRKLFTRQASTPADTTGCNDGFGKPGDAADANCEYTKAPFFNVLAAYWIQFMTHDWFSHLDEGRNTGDGYMKVGCASQKVNGVETPLTPEQAAKLGCRPGDAMERIAVADSGAPERFRAPGELEDRLTRAPKTFRNTNTAWWDASQLYGYDDRSRLRVKRDPNDPAKLLMVALPNASTEGDTQGYLPVLGAGDPMSPEWAGQEATGFPDNWTIGMSFYHNVFAREHNAFVSELEKRIRQFPDSDSGLRDPANPSRVIHYKDLTPDEMFEAARLVVAAEIAKIHTIEWTTQLLYDEPLFRGMNGNWGGLSSTDSGLVATALATVLETLRNQGESKWANQLYSAFAAGPGIVGMGNWMSDTKFKFDLTKPEHVNGGPNHFGSPFNFPEEFITVYRLHPLVPDLIEYRDYKAPNEIHNKIPVVATFRGRATNVMHERGLANLALSMGRQRLGALALQNHPRFLQNLQIDRLQSPTKKIDVVALDIIRDRERGVPRFNEFRRQYGLRQLTSFDDFIDVRLPDTSTARKEQKRLVALMRDVYGTHQCDDSKVITHAQLDASNKPITDCLGHANGSTVDNVEDLDTVVGWLAESTRPHGFAISETQFVVFILNASRRLFSDRFFTSSFRPEFYTRLGYEWVNNNGPMKMVETRLVNGRANQPVSPLKRVLLRTVPELSEELSHVDDAFDPWARDRGTYYSLRWKPRKGAESDPAFAPGKPQ
ncbi:MAG TPA: peroxidase family protein [Gemmatimonadaceae bacterium]|nr:peroxidase family protein [Gemmatimonadaceae bacterium]